MRAALLGGIAGPIVFACVVVAVAALTPGYSHVASFVSELGATGSPHAALMNYLGFIPTGLLLGALGVALGRALPADRFRGVVSLLVTVFGLGLAACGLATCDEGCPYEGGSTRNLIHNAVAIAALLSATGAAGIVGVRYARRPEWRSLSRYSLVTSVVAALCLLVIGSLLESRLQIGLWQRLLLTTLLLWCAVVARRVIIDGGEPRNAAIRDGCM
jgi:hypothetical membrane protein